MDLLTARAKVHKCPYLHKVSCPLLCGLWFFFFFKGVDVQMTRVSQMSFYCVSDNAIEAVDEFAFLEGEFSVDG